MASKLKRYEVKVQTGRNTVDTIMKLTPDEAERIGAKEYVKDGAKPGTSRAPKGRTAANKSRTPRNKSSKPAAVKTALASKPAETPKVGIEDASDPGASE